MTVASTAVSDRFGQGVRFLARRGLNLAAVMDCAGLPDPILDAMRRAQVPLDAYSRLLLLGHAGRAFWQALNEYGVIGSDPVDHYSRVVTRQLVRDYLDDCPYLLLYPGDYPIPLQQLGALAGWHHPSPLGIGIHPHYGLWFAYRAAFLIDSDLPPTPPLTATSPCASCATKPCITACPAGAVNRPAAPDIDACIDFRLSEYSHSLCQSRCLARLACPVAAEHRYSARQMHYHASRSLHTLRVWRESRST